MASLKEIREKYPQYQDMSDQEFADKFHKKFYSDMPRSEFDAALGISDKQKQTDSPWYEDLTQAGRSLANTMTFGLADKAAGAGQMLADYIFGPDDTDLEKSYYQPKRERQQWAQQNPKKALTAEVIGTFANPVAKPVGKYLGQSQTLGQLMRRSGGIGAGWAGTQSLGESEGNLAQRLMRSGESAGYGGAFGVMVPPAIKGTGYLWNQTFGRLPGLSANAAQRKVLEALQRDRLTPEQAMARVQQLGPEGALMDVGPNSKALAYQAYAVPGRGKQKIESYLTSRQEGTLSPDKVRSGGQAQRIQKGIDKLVPENYYASKAATEAERKLLGGKYREAGASGDLVDTSNILKDLDTEIISSKGSIKSGLEKVRKLLLDEKGRPEIDIPTLHQAKMAIDDFLSGEARGSIGSVAKRRIQEYQQRLVDAIESSGEGGNLYQSGRMGYRAQWKLDEAMDQGRSVFSKSVFESPQAMQTALKSMNPEELNAFRIGVAQSLKSKVGDSVVRADATKKLMGIPSLEQKLRMAFGSKSKFRQYMQMLENEAEMFDTRAKVLSGSQTAERLEAIRDGSISASEAISPLQKINLLRPGSWMEAAMDYAKLIGQKTGTGPVSGPMSERLAGMLTGRNVEQAMPPLVRFGLAPDGHFFSDALLRGGAAEIGAMEGPLSRYLLDRRR